MKPAWVVGDDNIGALHRGVLTDDRCRAGLSRHHVIGQDAGQQRGVGLELLDGRRVDLGERLVGRCENGELTAVEGVDQIHFRIELPRKSFGKRGEQRVVGGRDGNRLACHRLHRARPLGNLLGIGRAARTDQFGTSRGRGSQRQAYCGGHREPGSRQCFSVDRHIKDFLSAQRPEVRPLCRCCPTGHLQLLFGAVRGVDGLFGCPAAAQWTRD